MTDLWREVRAPALAFVAHAALVAAPAALAVAAFAQQRPIKAAGVYAIPPTTGLSHYLVDPLRNWDGFWYTWIADRGYHDHPAIAAFWPLYPLLMRLVHALTGWS
ncbi:MAG: hypothetical protein IRY97_03915, partial [Thermomicrobiaceae bacterium]|nr:hypothetical protein [Thermomicrobiaceae bacterium]